MLSLAEILPVPTPCLYSILKCSPCLGIDPSLLVASRLSNRRRKYHVVSKLNRILYSLFGVYVPLKDGRLWGLAEAILSFTNRKGGIETTMYHLSPRYGVTIHIRNVCSVLTYRVFLTHRGRQYRVHPKEIGIDFTFL